MDRKVIEEVSNQMLGAVKAYVAGAISKKLRTVEEQFATMARDMAKVEQLRGEVASLAERVNRLEAK